MLGPDNVAVGAQNPGPPDTDVRSLPNLKWSLAASHNRLREMHWHPDNDGCQYGISGHA